MEYEQGTASQQQHQSFTSYQFGKSACKITVQAMKYILVIEDILLTWYNVLVILSTLTNTSYYSDCQHGVTSQSLVSY